MEMEEKEPQEKARNEIAEQRKVQSRKFLSFTAWILSSHGQSTSPTPHRSLLERTGGFHVADLCFGDVHLLFHLVLHSR